MLAGWKTSPSLNVLQDVIKCTPQFARVCTALWEIDSEHTCLLIHGSKLASKVDHYLEFCFHLSEPLGILLEDTPGSTAQWHRVSCKTRLLVWHIWSTARTLSYLPFQGRVTVFKPADKVAAFKIKLKLWGWEVEIGNLDVSQTLAEILKSGLASSQLMHYHLPQCSKQFECFFPMTTDPGPWLICE